MKINLIILLFSVSLHAQTNYFGGEESFSGEEVIQIPQQEIKETEIFIYQDNIRPPQPQFRVRDNVIIPLENGIEQPQKRIEINETRQDRTNRLEYIQRTISKRRTESKL